MATGPKSALRTAACKQLCAALDGATALDVPAFVQEWEQLEAQQLGGLQTKPQESAYRQRIFELKRALKNPQAELKQCILSGSLTPAQLARTTDLLNPERKLARDAQRPLAVCKVDKEAERQARQYARQMGRGGSDAGDSDVEAPEPAPAPAPSPSPKKPAVIAARGLTPVRTPKAKPIKAVQSAYKKQRSLKIAQHASGGLVVQEAAPCRVDRESPRTKMMAAMTAEPPVMATPPYLRDKRQRQQQEKRQQEQDRAAEQQRKLAQKQAREQALKAQQEKKKQRDAARQAREQQQREKLERAQARQQARLQKEQEQQKLLEQQQQKIRELEAQVLQLTAQRQPRSPCPTLHDLGLASPLPKGSAKKFPRTPKASPKGSAAKPRAKKSAVGRTPKAPASPKGSAAKPSRRKSVVGRTPKAPPASPKAASPKGSPRTVKTIKKVRIQSPLGAAPGKKKAFARTPHPKKAAKPTTLCDEILLQAGLREAPAEKPKLFAKRSKIDPSKLGLPVAEKPKLFAKRSKIDLSKLGLPVAEKPKDKPKLFAKRSKVPILGLAKDHVGLTPKKRLSAASVASLSTAASTGRASLSSAGTPRKRAAPLSTGKRQRLSLGAA